MMWSALTEGLDSIHETNGTTEILPHMAWSNSQVLTHVYEIPEGTIEDSGST